jgi:AraC-like DNA-binding protein
VIYVERQPGPPLHGFIRALWYAKAPHVGHARERVLPSGRVQVILNLARDFLLDCPEGRPSQPVAPALVVGARSVFEIVDSSDMADLIGIVFEPGGFGAFAGDAADLFTNRSVVLDDVWGAGAPGLRNRLREIKGVHARLAFLEGFLLERFAPKLPETGLLRRRVVGFALGRFEGAPGLATVRDVARSTGWSERRFSQVFREEVGFSPKVWCRIQRFQRIVRRLHAGGDLPWAELALDCGFYDQSHFANEFRAFSGIDATTYSALPRTPWANHVPVE